MRIQQLIKATVEPVHIDEVKEHLNVTSSDDDNLINRFISAARAHAEQVTGTNIVAAKSRIFLDGFFTIEIPIRLNNVRSITSIKYKDSSFVEQTLSSTIYEAELGTDYPSIYLAYDKEWPVHTPYINSVKIDLWHGVVSPFTISSVETGQLTSVSHGLTAGSVIQVTNSGGDLPAGLTSTATYTVINPTTDTLQLSTDGATPVTITTAGTGINYLGTVPEAIKQAMLMLVAHWYENRETVNAGSLTSSIPFGADQLLVNNTVW
jgi:uncharacterized phiE125 gp8 family phage protein